MNSYKSVSQSCPDSPGSISEFRQEKICSFEKKIWWNLVYNVDPSEIDPASFDGYFVFNWGDDVDPNLSTVDVFPATFDASVNDWEFTNPGPLPPAPFDDSKYAYFGSYPDDLGVCEINVTASLEFMPAGDPYDATASFKCSSLTVSRTEDYYSFDNQAPGNLIINPQGGNDITVCQGGATVTLFDDSEFNCVALADTDNPNDKDRHVRWVYGVAGSDMNNVVVDDGGIYQQTINGVQDYIPQDGGNDLVDNYPEVVTNASDNSESLEITIPPSADVGDVFIVRLDNWNPCNPYNPADDTDPAPVSITKTIRIVAAPDAAPEVRDDSGIWQDNSNNPNAAVSFCVGDDVDFRVDINEGDTYDWDFDWNGNINEFGDSGETASGANINNINFSTAGKLYQIGLRITRGNTGPPCIEYRSIFVQIEDGPVADFTIDVTSPNQCESITFNTINNSTDPNSDNNYTWAIYDDGGNPITPTNFSGQENDVTLNGIEVTGIGEYTVELTASSPSAPNCPTTDTNTFFIYDNPEADFSATEVCSGDITVFTDLSNIPTVINGDDIDTLEFVFDFNNTDFTTDPEGTFDAQTITPLSAGDFTANEYEHIYPSAGTYNVALRVTTDNGCISPVDTMTVVVKENPISNFEFADNGIDYTQPLCPGTPIEIKNTSPAGQTDPSVDRFYVEIISEDNANDGFFPTAPGSINSGDSAIINPNPGDLPNPFSAATYTYDFYFIAVGDNNCETREGPISVTFLPSKTTDFDIFTDENYTVSYNPADEFCSPKRYYFRIDSDITTDLNDDDSLVWTVTDITNSQFITDTTVLVDSSEPYSPDTISFNLINEFPEISAVTYEINLQPYVNGICYDFQEKTVRVLPKPISDFTPADTVVTCDSVTYYFEAEQPGLLTYDWQVQPTADTLSTQNDGVEFWVSYNRPDVGDPDVNVAVQLQTTNPFNCVGDLSDPFNDTILPKDDINVVLNTVGNEFCTPAVYGFVNNTNPADVPAGTEWELIIKNLDINDSTIIDGNSLAGNEEFRESDPGDIFEYTFTDSANYEIRLNALLPSTCDVASDPPISLGINESPTVDFDTNISEGCAPFSFSIINETSSVPSGNDFNLTYEVRRPNGTLVSGYTGTVVKGPSNPSGLNNLTLSNLSVPAGSPYIDYDVILIAQTFAGCTAETTQTVRVFQEPDIDFDILPSNTLCEDYNFEFEVVTNNITNADFELTWNWGDGQTFVTDNNDNVNHTFSNRASFFGSDTYTVNLSIETEYGCIASVSKPVNLNPRVQAGFFKDKEQGCSPLPVNFTSNSLQSGISGNHQYEKRVAGTNTWVPFDNSPSNNGAVAETFSNSSDSVQIFEIRYNVFSDISNGTICYDTAAIDSLTVFPEFNSPAITGPDEVCAFAQQIPFTVDASDGSNYQWSLPSGAFIINSTPTGDSINVNFSSFSGNVQVIEIDSNGCFGNPTLHPVSILTGPSGTLSLNGNNVICPGDSTSLIFNLTGPGSQNFDVIYNNGVSNDTLLNIPNGHIEYVKPTVSTNYFLLSVEDREYPTCNPSSISGSAFVSVNVKPTATLSGSTTICEGNNANLFFNLTGIGPWEVVYTDGNSNFTINSNNPVTIESVSPADSTTYSLVSVTDGNTPVCSGDVSGNATIEVNPKPSATISGSQNNVCVNTPTELEFNLTGTPPWNVRYTDGENIFTLANVTPEAGFNSNTDTHTEIVTISAAPGTKNYTLVDVIDSNTPNCSGDVSGSATITAFDRPEVEIEGNNTICLGDSSPLTFNFTGDGPFDVLITANQDTIAYNNLQNGESISQTPEVSTVYRVIELTDNRGCLGNSLGGPVSINVNNLPTSEISGDDVICYGEETELTFDQTGAGPWTITYTNGSQNFTFTTSFNRHFEPVSPTVTTTYSLVSVVDSNAPDNCSGTVSGSVLKEVFPELEASFEATPENMILPESTVNITNNTTNKNEWEYEWDFGDGTISNEVDPAPHEYGTYGEFVIRMTATNGQCTDTYQATITIGAIPPIVDFDANPKEGCLPLVVEFENLTQFADPSTYQWEFGDGQRVAAVENPTHVYRNPGIYTVTLSASNITGQRTQMIKEEFIEVFATPQASFTIPDEYRSVFTGEEVRFVNLSQGADEYIWKFGDGNESFEFEPIHAYPDSGLYDITLIAINSETGCTDSVSLKSQVQVILGGESDVPNAFTPSRAGPGTASDNPLQNDYFLPRVEGVSQFNMKIYNRWGELLFESNNKDEGWDGYFNGVLMPQGVYVYRLELVYENGRRETKVGDITLIR